jgi:hypothetical protein
MERIAERMPWRRLLFPRRRPLPTRDAGSASGGRRERLDEPLERMLVGATPTERVEVHWADERRPDQIRTDTGRELPAVLALRLPLLRELLSAEPELARGIAREVAKAWEDAGHQATDYRRRIAPTRRRLMDGLELLHTAKEGPAASARHDAALDSFMSSIGAVPRRRAER